MHVYNPKEWGQLIFSISKSDTLLKSAPMIAFITVLSFAVIYIELDVFKISADSWAINLPQIHSLLSFVISLLLVFRTNTAYDRWWEGRKPWGDLVNNSRNPVLKIAGKRTRNPAFIIGME